MYTRVSLCGYMCEYRACRGQLDSLELKSLVVMSHAVWLLGTDWGDLEQEWTFFTNGPFLQSLK